VTQKQIDKQIELAIAAEQRLIEQLFSSGYIEAIKGSGLSGMAFLHKGYGALFAVIQKVGSCDTLAIREQLQNMGSGQRRNAIQELARERGLEEIDGLPIDLFSSDSGTPGAAEEAVRQVEKYAMLRNIKISADRISKAATADGANPDELLTDFQKRNDALQKRSTEGALSAGKQRLQSLAELAPELLEQRAARRSGVGNVLIGSKPVCKAFDCSTGAWWPGVHILVATPKAGKTQFVLQEAVGAADREVMVAYLSLELGQLEVEARVLGILEKKPFTDLLQSPVEEIEALQVKHKEVLSRFRVFGGAGHRLTPESIEESAASLAAMANGQSCFMVVDYLQKMGGQGDIRERISAAADYLHTFGERYNVPILAVSTVGRAGYDACNLTEETKDKYLSPDYYIGLGKESGDIEYSAQTVMAIVHTRDNAGHIDSSKIALAASRRSDSKWIEGLKFERGQWINPRETEQEKQESGDTKSYPGL